MNRADYSAGQRTEDPGKYADALCDTLSENRISCKIVTIQHPHYSERFAFFVVGGQRGSAP